MIYDVAIIGAGVSGCMTAMEMTRYTGSVCLLERGGDVCSGASKANSAIVHAGFDAKVGSRKARFNVEGNYLMEDVCKRLSVHFKQIGSYVIAQNDEEVKILHELLERGNKNGVPGLEIIDGNALRSREPNVSPKIKYALHASTAGIVDPFVLTSASAEIAVLNGAELFLEFCADKIEYKDNCYCIWDRNGTRAVQSRLIINAAGVHADDVARLAGFDEFNITPRRGEYMLMDKTVGGLVSSVIFQPPTDKGKGILVAPTADGNLLVGPNSIEIADKFDTDTTSEGLEEVFSAALYSVPTLSKRDIITSFSGLRATPSTGDFILGFAGGNFLNAAGIESPGLTSAPAVGKYIAELATERLKLTERKNYINERTKPFCMQTASTEERNEAIARDSRYGRIICRCETVTEGEIADAINRPAGARNLDAVKRRVRAGLGRCQGGFCSPRVVEILSRELNISMSEVTKNGGSSYILSERTK